VCMYVGVFEYIYTYIYIYIVKLFGDKMHVHVCAHSDSSIEV